MTPIKAELRIFTADNQAVTIGLYPMWAAKLIKAIKHGPARLSLVGSLPEGSLEANPSNRHWQISPEAVTMADLQGWAE